MVSASIAWTSPLLKIHKVRWNSIELTQEKHGFGKLQLQAGRMRPRFQMSQDVKRDDQALFTKAPPVWETLGVRMCRRDMRKNAVELMVLPWCVKRHERPQPAL